MPVDADGNRADMVVDPISIFGRTNFGRLYEQYINSASRDFVKELRRKLDIQLPVVSSNIPSPNQLERHPAFEECWGRLMRYYQIVSPERMYDKWFVKGGYKLSRGHAMQSAIRNDVLKLYMPPENEPETPDIVEQLEREFTPCWSPVTYTGYSGRPVTTKKKVRIGSMYILLLEKTGDDWTAVSSGKLQNFGVLAQITHRDKYSQPTRNQAIRAFGETEIRIVTAYMGGLTAAEILDRNNNIATHQAILQSILKAVHPTSIACVVDRQQIPLGSARPLQFVKHLAMCAGWKFFHMPHVPAAPNPVLLEAESD